MLQTPDSSWVMGTGLAPSRDNMTVFALGSRNLKVTVRSGCTSGEMTGGRGVARGGAGCAQAHAVTDKNPIKRSISTSFFHKRKARARTRSGSRKKIREK